MDTISKAKKLQAMHSLKTQFYYNLMFLSFLALTCSLLFSFPLWFPSLCSTMKLFLSLSIPNKFSSFFSPKCLFILVNVIVVFLVGESRFVGSHSSPVGEIYDEYVERSWSLRGVSAHQDKAEESKLEVNLVDQETTVQDKEVVLKEEVAELTNKGDKEVAVKEEEDGEANELTSKGKKDAHEEVKVKEDRHEEKEISEEEEESGLPPEELNRRVEEFIARVNKQRWLQAQLLVSCKA
ncbi:hypothetical protein Peur_056838 [Populus x canadensis]|uniref:DUF4408 domain-containing protein n=1 Tax=Populus deltoides TaxID=3696 RepID=A0A8T2Z6G5_POPDE|nr:hypothetical protein H0E87_006295 [Populus deltoides]